MRINDRRSYYNNFNVTQIYLITARMYVQWSLPQSLVSGVDGAASEEENSLKVLESNRLPLDPKYHELDPEIMPLQR